MVVTHVLESANGDYTASVVSDVEELYSYNNESVPNISAEIEPAILDATINGQILKVSLNAAESGTVCCAEYDVDGKLITVHTQPVTTGKQVKTLSLKENFHARLSHETDFYETGALPTGISPQTVRRT